jgi:hypothetical protein
MLTTRMDVDGLAEAGLWVRRQRSVPSLTDEVLSLSQVMQIWDLGRTMAVDRYHVGYAEVSSPDLQPAWVYLVELEGRRESGEPLLPSHPLSQADPGEPVRLLALVQPPDFLVPGALVEVPGRRRRMLWLQAAPVSPINPE